MRTVPVAVLVILFASLSILLIGHDAAPVVAVVRPVPVRTALPHAVKASMPLHPPRLRVVR